MIYLSLTSEPPDLGSPEVLSYGHVLAYGWLMLWFAQIHRAGRARLAIAAALCLLGVGLEYAQGMTGYRTFDYADMLFDVIGVALGLALACTSLQDALAALERLLPAPA